MIIRLLSALSIIFALSGAAQAQIIIRHQNRQPNLSPGCCGPATLESVARSQGYSQLTGYTVARSQLPYGKTVKYGTCPATKDHPCYYSARGLSHLAGSRGIPHTFRPEGTYDMAHVKGGLASGRPVIVSVRGEQRCQQGHFYAVVGLKPGAVLLYDTNLTHRPYTTMSPARFHRIWDGSSLILGR